MRTAWIAGATGLVGGHCLAALLASARYGQVVALVRKPLNVRHPKLIESSLEADAAPQPDDVFCALGTTIGKAGSQDAFREVDQRLPLQIAKRARGASQFLIVSSVGAHAPGSNFYLQVKRETEVQLAELGFGALHVFRPSFLIGQRNERRRAERIGIAVAQSLQWSLIGGLRKYRPIEASAVARAMVAAALRDSAGEFIYHYDDMMGLV